MEKNVIITGANSGIGKSAAYKFAANGYKVIMACRNMEISAPVCEEIKRKTKNDKVELFQLDISSKKSIYAFCDKYRKKYESLDILIHNAGHFNHWEKKLQQSADGLELTLATNLFGPVLMTRLLSDVLAKSDHPRVLHACSTNIKHFFDERRKIDFTYFEGTPQADKSCNSYHLYGDSKMGLLMATCEMAKELKPLGISVNALMIPATKMSKKTISGFRSYWKLLAILQQPLIPAVDVVSGAYYQVCTSDDYAGITGKLINHRGEIVKAAESSMSFAKIIRGFQYYPAYVDDRETARRVWEICCSYK